MLRILIIRDDMKELLVCMLRICFSEMDAHSIQTEGIQLFSSVDRLLQSQRLLLALKENRFVTVLLLVDKEEAAFVPK